jgi:hypothetical protein
VALPGDRSWHSGWRHSGSPSLGTLLFRARGRCVLKGNEGPRTTIDLARHAWLEPFPLRTGQKPGSFGGSSQIRWDMSHLPSACFFKSPRNCRQCASSDSPAARQPPMQPYFGLARMRALQHQQFRLRSCERSRSYASQSLAKTSVGPSLPPRTPLPLLSSRRSGAKPCTAQRSGGGATSSFDLLNRGALS